MARGGGPRRPQRAAPRRALNAPFAELKQRLGKLPPKKVVAAPAPVVEPPSPEDPALFTRAMEGVKPLPAPMRARVERSRPSPPRAPVSEEAEAIAALSDLVAGAVEFDISDTREHIEGAVAGLDPRILRRLRRGDFALQAHLDLHGMTAEPARLAVDRFLAETAQAGYRCVLIVHGRGLNSKDQIPILKERLKVWLARGRAARLVLAFATARPVDGGAGALYVLLRRDRKRRPIEVTEGAKR
jgi:DNA-nicking Smr family endonuclease